MKGMRSCFREIIFCSAFFRRSDCMAIGGYDENMRKGHEDWEFFIRLLDKKIVLCIRYPLHSFITVSRSNL